MIAANQTGYEKALRDGCACIGKTANGAAMGAAHLHHLNSAFSKEAVEGRRPKALGMLINNNSVHSGR